ncbi:hypothetical protein AAFF_G00410900 [Aldrovandia affinis]|uniref:Uncharacterized protein n=1 Tax=Aldrovandia affinis TaxID=143900 RepID=A0AAD7SBP7_9TELE|nr:hypothetical protein AAFF_G00410900 [Aldrovandia affinis]
MANWEHSPPCDLEGGRAVHYLGRGGRPCSTNQQSVGKSTSGSMLQPSSPWRSPKERCHLQGPWAGCRASVGMVMGGAGQWGGLLDSTAADNLLE